MVLCVSVAVHTESPIRGMLFKHMATESTARTLDNRNNHLLTTPRIASVPLYGSGYLICSDQPDTKDPVFVRLSSEYFLRFEAFL